MNFWGSFKTSCKKLLYPSATVNTTVTFKSNVVVLVLGWGGSKPRNLTRLINHYESRGASTIAHTMPLLCPKFIRSSFEQDIEKEVCKLKDIIENERKEKIVFHVHLFSQNGTWVYSALCQRGITPVPHRLIMDSAPHLQYGRDVIFEAQSLSRLFTSLILNKAQYYQFPITPIAKCGVFIVMSLSIVTDKLVPFKYYFFTNYVKIHEYLRDHSPTIPTLFIYSKGDGLIPPEEVRDYMKFIEARGTPTFEKLYGEEVSHICAQFKYPDEYKQLIDGFLELDN